jgi:hypothetical protein
MSTPAKQPVFSDAIIALAKEELKYLQRGDDFVCAIMRSHGKNYVLARTKTNGRSSVYAIDSDGRVYPTQLLDCLYSVVDEPDCYHFED